MIFIQLHVVNDENIMERVGFSFFQYELFLKSFFCISCIYKTRSTRACVFDPMLNEFVRRKKNNTALIEGSNNENNDEEGEVRGHVCITN